MTRPRRDPGMGRCEPERAVRLAGTCECACGRAPSTWAAVAVCAVFAVAPTSASAQERTDPSPAFAIAASVVLPGTGQLLRGERRGLAYLGAEAALWLVVADGRQDGADRRDAYRDLAWEVARGAPNPRRHGDFVYYERLTQWTRSGAFDVRPDSPGLQPETNPATFNGDAWRLARSLFWGGSDTPPDAEAEQAALEFYRERAYADDFSWDWSGAIAEQSRFARLIAESDDAFGRARLAVGGLVANRFLSGVDVWLSARTPGTTEMRLYPIRSGPLTTPHFVIRWRAGGRG